MNLYKSVYLTVFTTALLISSIGTTQAREIVDAAPGHTVRHDMHACPVGLFMTGLHNRSNKLSCIRVGQRYNTAEESVYRGIRTNGMMGCPNGTAMTGIHVIRNEALCAPLRNARDGGRRLVDSTTVRNGMKACPHHLPVVGAHVKKNLLTCQYWFK